MSPPRRMPIVPESEMTEAHLKATLERAVAIAINLGARSGRYRTLVDSHADVQLPGRPRERWRFTLDVYLT